MSEQYFYHITEKENLKTILEQGLIPKIGRNSKITNENKARIYLSDRDSLFYWNLIVKDPIVLKIAANHLEHDKLTPHMYSADVNYKENMYENTIPAEYIEITNIKPELTAEQNESLCLSFLLMLGSACDHLAYYETYSDCMV